QHAKGRDAGDATALEVEVVAHLREAGVKGALERCHGEVFSLCVLTMFGRRILITEPLRKIVVEVTLHHVERAGIKRREAGGGDPAQLLSQLLALFTINVFPRGAVLPLVSSEQS